MLSLKLWRSLANPPRQHPLFQQVLSKADNTETRVTAGFFMYAFMCSGFTFIWTVIFDWILYIVLGLFILINTIYAVRWVMRIAANLVEEKEAQRYDLLATLPLGLLGTSWAISVGSIHRRSSFRFMPHIVLMSAMIILMMLCGMSVATFFVIEQITNEVAILANIDVAKIAIASIPVVIIFYFDHVYSILTAVLFGQWIGSELQNPEEARMRAGMSFLALQILIYAFTFGLNAIALPSLFAAFGYTDIPTLVGISIFSVIFFIVLREGIIRFLWNRLLLAYHPDEDEIALVLEPFHRVDAILKASQAARLNAASAGNQ